MKVYLVRGFNSNSVEVYSNEARAEEVAIAKNQMLLDSMVGDKEKDFYVQERLVDDYACIGGIYSKD
jgi:hypothetical protein